MSDFFLHQHDPVLVLVAAGVCLIASYAGMSLVRHALTVRGQARLAWIGVSAVAVGVGIWATHFIGLLGYRFGYGLEYEPWTTALSLGIAIVFAFAGFYAAATRLDRTGAILGGAVLGLGIVCMHFTGMAAVSLAGTAIHWNWPLAALSVAAGIGLGAPAMYVGVQRGDRATFGGAALLALAVLVMHFTAMRAAADMSRSTPHQHVISAPFMTADVAAGTIAILVAALAAVMIDNRGRRRRAREQARIDAVNTRFTFAIRHIKQGIGVFENGRLTAYNPQFAVLSGLPKAIDPTGYSFEDVSRAAIANRLNQQKFSPEQIAGRITEFVTKHMALINQPGGGEMVAETASGHVLRIVEAPVAEGSWVTTIEDITDWSKSQETIARLSSFDSLTGLPNRAQYMETLAATLKRARTAGRKLAIIQVDITALAEINTVFGPATGDQVLKALADRAKAEMQLDEVLARLGGDEFAVIKPYNDDKDLSEFLRRLFRVTNTELEIDTLHVRVSSCIGVSTSPSDAEDAGKLVSLAYAALDRAKADRPGTVYFYDAQFDAFARRQRDLTQTMLAGVGAGQFYLTYQEQRSLRTGTTTGYEALLRWTHPEYGPIAPAEFIPLAESSGYIGALGKFALRQACLDMSAADLTGRIAVNLSPLQLADPELPQQIAAILEETEASPWRLCFEVTESTVVANRERALETLRAIRATGATTAIDDFGTGYSSLDTLRAFPFDKLKLDKSLVNEVAKHEDARAVVRAVVMLGKALGMKVLAEGVETADQLNILRSEGCDEIQGYLIGKPQKLTELLLAGELQRAS